MIFLGNYGDGSVGKIACHISTGTWLHSIHIKVRYVTHDFNPNTEGTGGYLELAV